ncbi:MAG TPA: sugar phosphate isomerase/epimerase family protein [Oscillospiraceae bacterium]|nr:sugar phosphate isomerase/epimerase family protein [Oscillospiraceae bacterium]HPS34227.1 sugar phosphate isomerase/epimerase family protein [Oscillospiraceae bacterium]
MSDRKNWPLAVSLCARSHPTENDFFELNAAGVKAIELSYAYSLYPEIEWKNIQTYSKQNGIALWSFHLPFEHQKTNPAHPDPAVRTGTLRYDAELAKQAADIGVKVLVVHPSGEPIEECDRAESMKESKNWVSKLADLAETLGMKVAVENLPRTCLGRNASDMTELLEDPRLFVCFDTNHLLMDTHEELIKAVSGRILTLHVSDYDFINERHWLPGEGKTDWPELIAALEKADYDGPWLYEISRLPEKTIVRRPLAWRDFADNHAALMTGKQPDRFGFPLCDPLPMWVD